MPWQEKCSSSSRRSVRKTSLTSPILVQFTRKICWTSLSRQLSLCRASCEKPRVGSQQRRRSYIFRWRPLYHPCNAFLRRRCKRSSDLSSPPQHHASPTKRSRRSKRTAIWSWDWGRNSVRIGRNSTVNPRSIATLVTLAAYLRYLARSCRFQPLRRE